MIEGEALRVSNADEAEKITGFAGFGEHQVRIGVARRILLGEHHLPGRGRDRVIGMTEKEFESSPTRWTFG